MKRAILRNMIRTTGQRKGMKPSLFLHNMWNRIQVQKWGKARYIHNVKRGNISRAWGKCHTYTRKGALRPWLTM